VIRQTAFFLGHNGVFIMFFDWWRKRVRVESKVSRRERRKPPHQRRANFKPWAEVLEDRTLPTIIFKPQGTIPQVQSNAGNKLSSAPVYLIFLGSYWSDTSSGYTLMNELVNASGSILDALPASSAGQSSSTSGTSGTITGQLPNAFGAVGQLPTGAAPLPSHAYLSALSQYNTDGIAYYAGAVVDAVDPWGQGNTLTDGQVEDAVTGGFENLGLPEPDYGVTAGPLYCVITPPGISVTDFPGAPGYHQYYHEDIPLIGDFVPYAWVSGDGAQQGNGIFQNSVDRITAVFSHEIVEAISDPGAGDGTIITNMGNADELCDPPEAENYLYRVNGVVVQSYWSAADNAYVIPDGNSQVFTVDGGNLIINGDQVGAGYNDAISIDETTSDQIQVTLNGETATFDEASGINAVTVNPGAGANTVRIQLDQAVVPITVNCGASDTVVLAGLSTPSSNFISLKGTPASLVLDDSADSTPRTVQVTADAISVDGNYFYAFSTFQAASWSFKGGIGDTFNISATPANLPLSINSAGHGQFDVQGTTTITSLALSGGGQDTFVFNSTGADSSVTLSGGAQEFFLVNNTGAGSNLTISGGSQASILIQATAPGSALTVSGGGNDTVFVGDDTQYGLAHVQGSILVKNLPGALTSLSIDNNTGSGVQALSESVSQDTVTAAGQTNSFGQVVVSTIDANVPYAYPLPTATIDYEYATTGSVDYTPGQDSQATIQISSLDPASESPAGFTWALDYPGVGNHADTITVGNSTDGLQDIRRALVFGANTNPFSSAYIHLVLDDSADAVGRSVTLDTGSLASTSATVGLVTGLAPISIAYPSYKTVDLNVRTGTGMDTVNVLRTAVTGPVDLVAGNVSDVVRLGNPTDGVQEIGNVVVDHAAVITEDDSADTANRTILMGASQGGSYEFVDKVSFSGDPGTSVSVSLGSGNDTVLMTQTMQVPVTIKAGTGTNTLIGPNVDPVWAITGPDSGSVDGLTFSGFQNLVGGTADDTFQFGPNGSISGSVDGGGGTNALDYSG
jgi:hypothetical protein